MSEVSKPHSVLLGTLYYADGDPNLEAMAEAKRLIEQVETLRELNERVIRERDEGHVENERLNEQLEAANARKDELWRRLLEMEDKYLEQHERAETLVSGSNPAKRPT